MATIKRVDGFHSLSSYLRGPHGLGAPIPRGVKDQVKGPNGLQLEVKAWRAHTLLVFNILGDPEVYVPLPGAPRIVI